MSNGLNITLVTLASILVAIGMVFGGIGIYNYGFSQGKNLLVSGVGLGSEIKYSFDLKDFKYTIDDEHASVFLGEYIALNENVEVPATYEIGGITYDVNISLYTFQNNNIVRNIKIDTRQTQLNNAYFFSCFNLETLELPNVELIGRDCIENCYSLVSVYLPNLDIMYDSNFSYCTSLKEIDLPKLTQVGTTCFTNCASLRAIKIPKLEVTNTGFLDNCTNLQSIDAPLLESFTGGSFMSKRLEKLDLNVFVVGSDFGGGCTALKVAKFNKLEGISDNFLDGCTNLQALVFGGEQKIDYVTGFLNNVSTRVKIYVKDSLVEIYKADAAYSAFTDCFLPLSTYKEVI